MKTILIICFLSSNLWAGGGYLSDGLSKNIGDTSYVNSPTESVTQTFTSSVTIAGTAFSVGGSTLTVAYGTVAIGKAPNNAIVLDVYDGATRSGVNIAAGGVNGTYYPLIAKNAGGTRGVWIRDNGYTGINASAPSAELVISSVASATDSICFLGARSSLPTTGYARGCIVYLTTDPSNLYLSTETVVGDYSWKAK